MNVMHFLITRFNIKHKWDWTKRGEAVLSENWLSHRFELFENY